MAAQRVEALRYKFIRAILACVDGLLGAAELDEVHLRQLAELLACNLMDERNVDDKVRFLAQILVTELWPE